METQRPSSAPSPVRRPFPWTFNQRIALCFIVAMLLTALGVRYFFNRTYVPAEQPPEGPRATELQDRIDPNTADWPALAALPVIGKTTAQRIIDDREAFSAQHPGQPAFTRPEDLKRVKGIGDATVRAVEPYLRFPATQPASREDE